MNADAPRFDRKKNNSHLKDGTQESGWFYPKPEVTSTVAMPMLGLTCEDSTDGVKNQGNKKGEWFWCDSRLDVS